MAELLNIITSTFANQDKFHYANKQIKFTVIIKNQEEAEEMNNTKMLLLLLQ